MFDLADSFLEGVKISPKHKFRGEPVPKNNCGWIKRLLIILCLGMDLSIRERVHVTSESLGLLKICWHLYCHMAIYTLIEHD